jgi:hypothetical protein
MTTRVRSPELDPDLQAKQTSYKTNNKLLGFSPQANDATERPPLVGEVRANFC